MNKEVHKTEPPFEGKRILVPMDYRMINLAKEILNFSKAMERYRYTKDECGKNDKPVRTAGRLMWVLNQYTPVIGKRTNPPECIDCMQEFHETCNNDPEDETRKVFGLKGRGCWCKCNRFVKFYPEKKKKK